MENKNCDHFNSSRQSVLIKMCHLKRTSVCSVYLGAYEHAFIPIPHSPPFIHHPSFIRPMHTIRFTRCMRSMEAPRDTQPFCLFKSLAVAVASPTSHSCYRAFSSR